MDKVYLIGFQTISEDWDEDIYLGNSYSDELYRIFTEAEYDRIDDIIGGPGEVTFRKIAELTQEMLNAISEYHRPGLPEHIVEALNSGDGTYRP